MGGHDRSDNVLDGMEAGDGPNVNDGATDFAWNKAMVFFIIGGIIWWKWLR